MNSIFLRAKHWQLFIPQMVIPFVATIILAIISAIVITQAEMNNDRPEDLLWMFYLIPVFVILCGFVQFAWFWNVLTKLSKAVNSSVRFPSGRIKLFFFIPIIYFCILPFYIVFVVKTVTYQLEENFLIVGISSIFVVLLHFFSIFCILHTIYFSAKIIRSAELQRNARFSTFVGYFFLIWIFPVGIWFIQPKINALISHTAPDNIADAHLNDLVDR